MIEYDKQTKAQQERLKDFVNEAILLIHEDNASIEHQIEMTQELFEQCLSSLVRIGSIRAFNRLCDEFPMQARIFDETMDKKLKDVEIPQYTSEEEQAQWERLKARIRKCYGENAI